MSDVYLHVGPVKTGSTYLQDLLWANRRSLADQGVLHPCEHANEMWFATNDIQDGAFVQFDMPEAAGVWDRVRDRALGFDGPSIMSHEVLGMSTDEHVATIAASLHPATLHVIVMARSLAALLPSLWQEKIKMVDPDIGWPEFVEEQHRSGAPWTDASLIVSRWLPYVPASRIHVVTVPPRGVDRGLLLQRFAAAIGVDTSGWEGGDAANASLDAVQSELIRRLNHVTSESLDIRAQRRLVNTGVLPLLRPADPGWRHRLPATARQWVEAESTRRIDRLHEDEVVIHGTLQDLETHGDPYDASGRTVTDSELLAEALRLIAASHPDDAVREGPHQAQRFV